MKEISVKLTADGIKFGIIISRFNDFLTKQLMDGAKDCLIRHGADEKNITAAWVPGANETPMVADKMAQSGKYDVVIVLGAVIQGATKHAGLIISQVSKSLARTSIERNIPVINGLVCADNLEQAIERSGTKSGNKGWAAAQTAIEMANLYKEI
jgi:6,7-dimethyl-8-ribityllumazine synthase